MKQFVRFLSHTQNKLRHQLSSHSANDEANLTFSSLKLNKFMMNTRQVKIKTCN